VRAVGGKDLLLRVVTCLRKCTPVSDGSWNKWWESALKLSAVVFRMLSETWLLMKPIQRLWGIFTLPIRSIALLVSVDLFIQSSFTWHLAYREIVFVLSFKSVNMTYWLMRYVWTVVLNVDFFSIIPFNAFNPIYPVCTLYQKACPWRLGLYEFTLWGSLSKLCKEWMDQDLSDLCPFDLPYILMYSSVMIHCGDPLKRGWWMCLRDFVPFLFDIFCWTCFHLLDIMVSYARHL